MSDKMTCEQFFDKHYDDHDLSSWIDEMYWERSFSSEKIFNDMVKAADSLKIELTDKDDFDYEEFFWNVYQCTEKGLS